MIANNKGKIIGPISNRNIREPRAEKPQVPLGRTRRPKTAGRPLSFFWKDANCPD
jgi:hypothetical protein